MSWTQVDIDRHKESLREMGEARVRDLLAQNHWTEHTGGGAALRLVHDFLRECEAAPEAAHRRTVEELAKESNAIAREANKHADTANLIAWGAMIVAVIAMFVAAFKD